MHLCIAGLYLLQLRACTRQRVGAHASLQRIVFTVIQAGIDVRGRQCLQIEPQANAFL